MVMSMTLNDISRKLFKNNRKQYGLFFFSIVFSIAMTGAYGVLQYSPTVTNVLVDGGSTQTISQAMFFGSMLGIIVFLVYADSIFLKYKSREIGIFLSLGIDRHSVQKNCCERIHASVSNCCIGRPAFVCTPCLPMLVTSQFVFGDTGNGI